MPDLGDFKEAYHYMKTFVELEILRESVIYLSYRFANMLPESAYVCLQVIKTLNCNFHK